APDVLGPCDSDIAVLLRRGQRDAVRAGHVGAEAVKRAVGAQSVDASSGIGNAGLPLVGEVEVAVGGEVQVVQALKTLAEGGFEYWFQSCGLRVEHQQTLLVIRDEGTAILVELEAVRPAVVLHDEVPFLLRRDAEDAAERDVHDPEVALAIERRALEEAFDLGSLAVGI